MWETLGPLIETLLPLVVTGVLSIAAGVGFWTWLSARGERPLKRREVDAVAAKSMREVYGGMLDDLQSEIARHGERIDAQDKRINELTEEVRWQAATIERLRWATERARRYIDDLHERWEWHKVQDAPPPRPPLPPREEKEDSLA